MPSANPATTSVAIDLEQVEGRYAGHLTRVTAGTSVVEFTDSAELAPVQEAIGRNLAAMAEEVSA